MYKLCKSEQSATRQRELEHGLMEMMRTTRFEDISISDLCQQMNIPRKAFYRYFSGKDGALHGLIDHTLWGYEGFDSQLRPGRRTLKGELERFFEFWQSNHHLLEALDNGDLFGILIQRSIDYAVAETVLPNRFLSAEDIQMRGHVIQFAICGMMTMVIQWYREGYTTGRQEMARIAARLLERPLFPDMEKLL